MERLQIREALIDILEDDMGDDFSALRDEQSIRDDLGLDSVDVVSLVSQVERKFHTRLTSQELSALVKVGDLISLLEHKMQNPPSAAA